MSQRTPRGRPSIVPSNRISRLAGFGKLTAGIAGRAILDGARRFGRGELPDPRDLILTPSNILRVSDELARMRGAAMKLGQLISMDAGELLSPELAELMARLRADADFMPPSQINSVLERNLGKGWRAKFEHFEMRPMAAASIGQVHRAQSRSGQMLAVKVQYPGVARSIDGDIDNAVTIFRMSGLMPPREKLAPLIVEAKRQLREEADYSQETEYLNSFRRLLLEERAFTLPEVVEDLSTEMVLTMTFVPGKPIEQARFEDQKVRDNIVTQLIRLSLMEVFEFRQAQTDPNFANFTYDRETGKIGLLDFGATRRFSRKAADDLCVLLNSALAGDRMALRRTCKEIGIFDRDTRPLHENRIIDMILFVIDALRREEAYRFSDDRLFDQLRNMGIGLASDPDFQSVPPADILFLQRKIAGLYLLGRRLEARVPIFKLLSTYAD